MTGEIGTVTMYPKLERREWIFTPAPDPRDARIAELEAQLAAYHDNPLKRIVMIDGAWIGQSFGDLDAQATEYQARIAELEAALREIRDDLGAYVTPMKSEARTVRRIDAVLPRPPEGDMAITSEELDA